jgi:hypothetical protein
VTPIALRARLLEFLKFRVLAAQDSFFVPFGSADAPDAQAFRRWLSSCWPEALALDDADLGAVLQQARMLYVN